MILRFALGVVATALVGLRPTPGLAGPLVDGVAARSAEARVKYDAGEFGEALTLYRDAQVEDPDSKLLKFNVGDALYKTGDFEGALSEFLQSTGGDGELLQGHAWYNAGNAHFELQRYQEAIEAYKEALRRLPADDDAKANLELALQQMQEQSQSQPQENGDGEEEESDDGQTPESPPPEDGSEEVEPPQESESGDEGQEEEGSQSPTESEPDEGEQIDDGTMEADEAERLLDALASDELDAQHRRMRLKPGRQAKDW